MSNSRDRNFPTLTANVKIKKKKQRGSWSNLKTKPNLRGATHKGVKPLSRVQKKKKKRVGQVEAGLPHGRLGPWIVVGNPHVKPFLCGRCDATMTLFVQLFTSLGDGCGPSTLMSDGFTQPGMLMGELFVPVYASNTSGPSTVLSPCLKSLRSRMASSRFYSTYQLSLAEVYFNKMAQVFHD